MEAILHLETINPVLLLGADNQKIQTIEAAFKTTIVSRGNQLKLIGEKGEVSALERLLRELIAHIEKHGDLSDSDLRTFLRLYQVSPQHAAANDVGIPFNSDDVILHSGQGPIRPRNENQQRLYRSTETNDVIFSIGPAGTGKTYLAVAIASAMLKSQRVKKIILARPIVQAGEDLGYLPGDYKMKVNPYLRPLLDALEDFFEREQLQKLIEQETIEIAPLAYMRGRTLNNAFVILDEAQNTTNGQMKMFLTRLGRSSKAVITGDITQIDLPKKENSGLVKIQSMLKHIKGIDFIYFQKSDVVRHRLVQEIISAYERHNI